MMLRIYDDNRPVEQYPIISDNVAVQLFYEQCRLEGQSHNLAEMFALQQGPALQTDTTWLASVDAGGNQFAENPELGDKLAKQARDEGRNISGAVYMSSLADFPGDPRAWVRDRGEVRQICEERGWGCEGVVKVKRNDDVAPMASVDVADDLVDDAVSRRLEANPELEATPELWADTKEAIKPAA
jgi:hypothetical protein